MDDDGGVQYWQQLGHWEEAATSQQQEQDDEQTS